jgi:Tfp pilus assembly protein PilF
VKSSIASAPARACPPSSLRERAKVLVMALLSAGAMALASPASAQAGPGPTIQLTREMSDALAAETALAQARRLREEGDAAAALRTVEMALERLPRDVALRFTRAVMQADLGRIEAAMAGFTELTQEYPELPEPYNNLATLHAGRGELDQARAALDEAVRAMPAYALAWENLGDVHLRMAERAWQRASSLDRQSEAAAKLKLARDLIARITPARSPAPTGASSSSARPSGPKPPSPAPTSPQGGGGAR